jgi:parvulin-like peptidyl-prolyl isomerase
MAKESRQKTRGGMHRVERAERQQRLLIIGAVAVVSLVIFLVVGGSIFETYLRPKQTVATVGEEIITIGEFEARVRYERVQWVYRYVEAQRTMQLLGDNPEFASQVQQQMEQISYILDPVPFAERILNQLIDERLIRQEAQRRGIVVTEEEINDAVLARYSYFPNGTPTLEATETIRATSTLSTTQYAIMTSTPTAMITPTLTPIIEVTSGIFTLTPTPTEGDTPTPEATATGGIPTLTPTVMTTQLVGDKMLEELEVFAGMGFDETELRKLHEFDLYRQRLWDALTADVDREQEQVWVRHILVEDEGAALDVLNRLEKGEDWADLVVEELSLNSTSKLQGGDLGWFADYPQEPDYTQDFLDAAFGLKIGEISAPIESPSGWHIIQILGKEIRQLSLNELNQINQNIFLEFVDSLNANTEISIISNWQARVPDQPDVQDPLNPGFPIPQ